MNDLFAGEPLRTEAGIPVFSESSPYIENYETIAKTHLSALKETGHNPWMPESFWRQLEASTAELVRRYASAGASILDVGVGLGRLMSHLPNYSRHGMDISLDYLKVAREEGIEVCMALVEDMPFKDETFDLVVCTDVLEHVFDLNFAVSQILRVIKPGGSFVLRVPYKEDLSGYLAPDFPFQFVHLRSFDESGLRLLLEKIFACEVLEVCTSGHLLSSARLANPTPEATELLEILPKLESIAPDLYWETLRRLQIPIEINVVVRVPERGARPKSARAASTLPTPPLRHVSTVADTRLLELQEKVAYLSVRARDSEGEVRFRAAEAEAAELAAKFEVLQREHDQALLERDAYRKAWERAEQNPGVRLKRFLERFKPSES